MTAQVIPHSKKHKFVADGLFKAELDSFFQKELAEDGYSGVEVRITPQRTEIIVQATRTQEVLGEKGRRIRELTALIQKRYGFSEGAVELYAEKVQNRGLCAPAQAESLRYKLLGGLAVRRACYGVLRFVMESGAQGCEIVVSGKLRGQRAKSMKFSDGLMIHAGEPSITYIQQAVRGVCLKQGVLGIKVKIMLPHDIEGKRGPKTPMPDKVVVVEPKPDETPKEPYSEVKDRPPVPVQQQAIPPIGQMAPVPAPLGSASGPGAVPPQGAMMGVPPLGMSVGAPGVMPLGMGDPSAFHAHSAAMGVISPPPGQMPMQQMSMGVPLMQPPSQMGTPAQMPPHQAQGPRF